MRGVKRLGMGFVVAMVLVAFAGVGIASATTLTGVEGIVVKTGTVVHAVNEGPVVLETSFKNIECSKSTLQVKTTNESGASISGNVESMTFETCNCEIKVGKSGTASITSSGSSNGAISSSGAEVTASCNSIFGTVHCIYVTSNTTSTLTGSTTTGATATTDVSVNNVPRSPTNSLCDEGAKLNVKYKIDSPDLLNVD